MVKTYKNLEEAFAILHNEQLFYFNILSSMTLKVVPGFPAAGGVYFNPKTQNCELFISEEHALTMSPTHLKVLLEHECEHISRRHMQIALDYMEDMTNKNNLRLANIAQDYLINDSISFWNAEAYGVKNYKGILAKREFLRGEFKRLEEINTDESRAELRKLQVENVLYFACMWPDIESLEELKNRKSHDISFIELFHILKKNNEQVSKEQESLDQHQPSKNESGDEKNEESQGKGSPSKDPGSPSDDGGGSDGESEAPAGLKEVPQHVADSILRKAADKTMEMTKGIGSISASAQMRLNQISHENLNLMAELNMFNNSITSSQKTRTWSKVNRRYPNMCKGSRKKNITKLVIWNDSSGSQWSEEIQQKVANAIKHLAKLNGDVEVLIGDTELKKVIKINDGRFNLNKFVIEGGGGTSPQFVYDYAKKNKADGVILITDGYIDSFKNPGIRTLTLLVGSQVKAIEGVKNIHLK